MINAARSADESLSLKAVLICSACDRMASVDGWLPLECDDKTDLQCPECGSVIVSQPHFDRDDRKVSVTV